MGAYDDTSDADFIAAQRNDLIDEMILDGTLERYRLERPPAIGVDWGDIGKTAFSVVHSIGKPLLSTFGGAELATQLEQVESPILQPWARGAGPLGKPQPTPQQQQQAALAQAAQAAQKKQDAQRTWLYIGGGVLGAALLVTLTALIARR